MARAFAAPQHTLTRATAYLDSAQLARASALAGHEVEQSVVSYYVAHKGSAPAGVVYFDRHRVRTLDQLLMIVVTPEGTVREIEVLHFAEPPEYRPAEAWLKQFEGRPLDAQTSLRRGIVNMTGATLSAQGVTRAVRRVLALHAVIRPLAPPR